MCECEGRELDDTKKRINWRELRSIFASDLYISPIYAPVFVFFGEYFFFPVSTHREDGGLFRGEGVCLHEWDSSRLFLQHHIVLRVCGFIFSSKTLILIQFFFVYPSVSTFGKHYNFLVSISISPFSLSEKHFPHFCLRISLMCVGGCLVCVLIFFSIYYIFFFSLSSSWFFFQHFFFIYIKTFYRLGVSSIFSGISPPTFSNDFLVSCSDHSKIISLLRLVLLQTHKTRLRHKDIKIITFRDRESRRICAKIRVVQIRAALFFSSFIIFQN